LSALVQPLHNLIFFGGGENVRRRLISPQHRRQSYNSDSATANEHFSVSPKSIPHRLALVVRKPRLFSAQNDPKGGVGGMASHREKVPQKRAILARNRRPHESNLPENGVVCAAAIVAIRLSHKLTS